MLINIENEYPGLLIPDQDQVIENVILAALDYEQCPYECQVQVLLTGKDRIHEMNREYRDIDRETDVLSFPASEYPVPGDFSDIEERDPMAFHPETGELILGDIVISMDRVKEQARDYGHSQKRELAFLAAHSMFHLMGYDHMDDEERLIMEEKQEKLLESLGILR